MNVLQRPQRTHRAEGSVEDRIPQVADLARSGCGSSAYLAPGVLNLGARPRRQTQ